jgi:hypothetical protein
MPQGTLAGLAAMLDVGCHTKSESVEMPFKARGKKQSGG